MVAGAVNSFCGTEKLCRQSLQVSGVLEPFQSTRCSLALSPVSKLIPGVSFPFGLACWIILPGLEGFYFLWDKSRGWWILEGPSALRCYQGIPVEGFHQGSLGIAAGWRCHSGCQDSAFIGPLNPSCFPKFDGHCGSNKAMVFPAVVKVDHSPCDVHIVAIAGSNNDIVNEVPLLRAGVSPKCLELIFLPKQGIGDYKVVLCAFT